jgi:hypothetical protein
VKTLESTWAIYLLLLFASVHCARSIFLVNVSLLDLPAYEQGTERMPFQGRVAMIPLLRWAHSSRGMAKAAAFLDASLKKTPHMEDPPEEYTPEKLACMLLGVGSIVAMTFAGVWFGRRYLGELWWTPPVLTLAMLYVTYAARYEMEFWYPYDLPHFAIFGIACLGVLEGAWVWVLALFLVDTPLRETSIYLVAVVLAVGYGRGKLKPAIALATAMMVVWLPVHVWIAHRFADNPSDTQVSLLALKRAILNPLHWPQIASAFGFLWAPLLLGRKWLTRDQRYLLLGAAPCLVVTLLFGIWYETRIWDEWIVPAAALLGTELAGRFMAKRGDDPIVFGANQSKA